MKSFLYDGEKIEGLLPSVRQIDAFLIAKGYTREEAGKTIGGFDHDVIVNRLKYRKGTENVFITLNKTREPSLAVAGDPPGPYGSGY